VSDERYMKRAVAEAKKALGRTHPNPAVGAVIVKAGQVIATGFHARAGTPHAEAVALAKAGPRAKGATLYSTLEPCNHQGRTPPCTEAIISAGIARVVYASADPNPLVNGKGHRRLVAAGVAVVPEVLREDADALNQPFFKSVTTGLPWVTLKAGVTLDGKLATEARRSKWITSEASRARAQALRNQVDAIVVGAGTVSADDPQLTTRFPGGRNPVRVVLDSRLGSAPRARVFDTSEARTIVATLVSGQHARARALAKKGVELWTLPARHGQVALRPLLEKLCKAGLLHVLVEGGAEVHAAFIGQRLADELMLFVAPKLFGHPGLTWVGELGRLTPATAPTLTGLRAEAIGDDLLLHARFASGR
jgi:diaminohydroxyphosphoribosylaminopyrimidine deaminase/5-amino-6-(5-phosphoribosylamino)uracil reductase